MRTFSRCGQSVRQWFTALGSRCCTSQFMVRYKTSSRLTRPDSWGYQHFERDKNSWPIRVQLSIAGGVCAGLIIFWASRRQTIPFTGRRHAIFVSNKREREIGASIFQQIKHNAVVLHQLLPESHRQSRLVRETGMRIARVASNGYSEGYTDHMKDLSWEFLVVDDGQVNAFVLPGGKVVVCSGLFRILKSVDELAAVLAHEVGHVIARHAAERISEMGILATIQMFVAIVFGIGVPVGLETLLVSLPHSRRAETEADLIGVQLMARACFNPAAAESMLRRLDQFEREQSTKSQAENVSPLLRTHPLSSERAEAVRRELPQAFALFSDDRCKHRHFEIKTSSLK